MIARIIPVLAFLVALPLFAQVEPGATGGGGLNNDSEMMTPAPASGDAYPSTFGSQSAANLISGGLSVGGAYMNNVVPGESAIPVNDATFSIFPSISMSRSTGRKQEMLSYTPSFLFYEPTSSLDTIDHGVTGTFHYLFSPKTAFELNDAFIRTSDVFDQSYTFTQPIITGSTQIQTPTVIAPFAEQMANTLNSSLSYQFGRDGMVGAGFEYSTLSYPSPTASPGLYNSHGVGPEAFYNRRLTRKQYIGFAYQYNRTVAEAVGTQSTTQTHSLLPFYSVYFARSFSMSITGGFERIDVSLPPSASSNSWSPSVNASIGWQGVRAYLAASYSRTVTAGEGLFGAFRSNSAGANGGFKLGRFAVVGLSVSYSNLTNVTPLLTTFTGGDTISGHASLSHPIGEHFAISCGYDQLHENYSSIAAISADPNSRSIRGTLSYQFSRPWGK